jgi:hypothetical protein
MVIEKRTALIWTLLASVIALAVLLAALAFIPRNDKAGDEVIVDVTIYGPNSQWVKNCTDVWTTNGTVFGVMIEAARTYNFTLSYDYWPGAGLYITAINGTGPQGMDGWLYNVNGALGSSVDAQIVNDGDEIVWWYGAWGSSPPEE